MPRSFSSFFIINSTYAFLARNSSAVKKLILFPEFFKLFRISIYNLKERDRKKWILFSRISLKIEITRIRQRLLHPKSKQLVSCLAEVPPYRLSVSMLYQSSFSTSFSLQSAREMWWDSSSSPQVSYSVLYNLCKYINKDSNHLSIPFFSVQVQPMQAECNCRYIGVLNIDLFSYVTLSGDWLLVGSPSLYSRNWDFLNHSVEVVKNLQLKTFFFFWLESESLHVTLIHLFVMCVSISLFFFVFLFFGETLIPLSINCLFASYINVYILPICTIAST